MATTEYKVQLFLTQLSDIAPAISELLATYPARLRASITSGDVVNTYGHSLSFLITVEVLTHRCRLCGDSEYTPPVFDCTGHRTQPEWTRIADTDAPGIEQAMMKLDGPVREWLQART